MGGLRQLGHRDLAAVQSLLDTDPITNLFVASRIGQLGLEPGQLGCPVWGYERDGQLVALCHAGANLVPVGDDPDALDAFAAQVGRRRAQSILGRSDIVRDFHQRLVERSGSWRRPREFRAHQPLLLMETDPEVEIDTRIRQVRIEEFPEYLSAAVKMYTEEVGVSPLDGVNSYQSYVWSLIRNARAFGAVADGRVWFKSDIGSLWADLCQIQGVWLTPDLRGRGLSVPAMAAATRLARLQAPRVSLYVNDYNIRALRMYASVGFRQVGELATVLY